MEEYMNLSSPLNENGVFVGDGQNNITNPSVQNLPTMSEYLKGLRQQIEEFDTSRFNHQNNNTSNYQPDTSKYQNDMRLSFPQLLKQEGINIRVTSELRKNAKTKSGNKSHHSYINEWGFSAACDIVPTDGNFDKLKRDIYNNPRIVAWLINHKIGILEETTQAVMNKTGATGKHFHVGPDKWAIKMSSNYINYNSTQNITPSNEKIGKSAKSKMNYVKNYLMSNHGLDAIHASALTGVWYAESGLNPSIKSKRDTGQGIAQWTGSRHQSFNRFYKQLFGRQSPGILNVGLDQQIDVAIAEYKSRSSNWRDFLNRNNLQDAVDSVLRGYENGGSRLASITDIDKNYKGNGYNRQMSVRLGYAQQALN